MKKVRDKANHFSEKKKIENCNKNTKKLWTYINIKINGTRKRLDQIDFVLKNGMKVTNQTDIANKFNNIGLNLVSKFETGTDDPNLPDILDKSIFFYSN